ncbi:MAG: efflux transporter outer membrane subunit [Bradymonadia bacterium]
MVPPTSLLLGTLAGVVGCHTHQISDPVKSSEITMPEKFNGQLEGVAEAVPERWWEVFEDPELTALMDRMLSGSLSLKQGWARLAQVEALAKQAGAANLPTLSVNGSASRSRNANPVLGSFTNNAYSISVAAAYEVDLWGRLDAQEKAATLDVKATRLDIESIAMTLAAQVAETWYSLVEQRAQLTLLKAQLETNDTLLELVEARFGQGLASAVDVFQQRQNVLNVKAQIPLIEAQVKLLEHALSLLVGEAPGSKALGTRGELPEGLPPVPEIGVPADLITRRPDIRSAHLRVKATDHRVGAAIASRFPSLRLNPSTGFTAFSVAELLDNWIYSLVASVGATVFDGGRINAEVERQRAALQEQVANLATAMLTALREIEDALIREEKQTAYLTEVVAQNEVAQQLLEETQARYTEGLSDFLPVLSAVQALQRAEATRLSARRQLISNRIQLYRALGGTWAQSLKAPKSQPAKSTGNAPKTQQSEAQQPKPSRQEG